MLTKQEIFDKVRDHLLTQRARSEVAGECCYLSDDGKRCAVGCLIPKHVDTSEFEGRRASTLPEYVLEAMDVERSREMYQFLEELQSIHDHIYQNNWAHALRDLALREGLRP